MPGEKAKDFYADSDLSKEELIAYRRAVSGPGTEVRFFDSPQKLINWFSEERSMDEVKKLKDVKLEIICKCPDNENSYFVAVVTSEMVRNATPCPDIKVKLPSVPEAMKFSEIWLNRCALFFKLEELEKLKKDPAFVSNKKIQQERLGPLLRPYMEASQRTEHAQGYAASIKPEDDDGSRPRARCAEVFGMLAKNIKANLKETEKIEPKAFVDAINTQLIKPGSDKKFNLVYHNEKKDEKAFQEWRVGSYEKIKGARDFFRADGAPKLSTYLRVPKFETGKKNKYTETYEKSGVVNKFTIEDKDNHVVSMQSSKGKVTFYERCLMAAIDTKAALAALSNTPAAEYEGSIELEVRIGDKDKCFEAYEKIFGEGKVHLNEEELVERPRPN